MASAAAVALADGIACRREALAAKTRIKILEKLNLFDSDHGIEIYAHYLDFLQKNPEKGRIAVAAALKPALDDAELTQSLVTLCHTIGEADGIVRDEEVDAIDDVCEHLGIDSASVKAVEIEIRDQLLVQLNRGVLMAGFFNLLVAHHKKNKERARNYDYFKACMAASALAAMADDDLGRKEDASLKKLMKVVAELKLFGRDFGTDMFASYVQAIKDDPDKGRAKAMDDVTGAKGDSEWTTTLLMLAATIIESDGVLEQSEKDTLQELGSVLGIDASTVGALDVNISDEIYK